VNGGRNYNGPMVSFVALVKSNQMLETLSIHSYSNSKCKIEFSENVCGADNQQERLDWWIVGFVDGEGTFSISFNRNATTRFGYQVFPEFVITQGEKSITVLKTIQKRFKCGNIYINRRKDNHKENLYRYTVRSQKDLKAIIIPFFEKMQLKTAKSKDFDKFVQILEMMSSGEHLNKEGFAKIKKIAETMNRKQSRILRDYTLDPE